MIISNKLYDALRSIADLILPALGTLWFGISGILNIPYADKVVGVITAVVAFMDVFLKACKTKYDEETKGQHEK